MKKSSSLQPRIIVATACITFFSSSIFAQKNQVGSDTAIKNNTTNIVTGISGKGLARINCKYTSLTDAIDRRSLKLLARMQARENRLKERMQSIDSNKVKNIFVGTQAKYEQLQTQLQSPLKTNISNPLQEYLPNLDSMQTAMRFLSTANLPFSADKLAQIQIISNQLQQLQGRLQQANDVRAFVREREQQLTDKLSQYGLGRQLLGINKQVYYFQQQLVQYKEIFNDKEKMEALVFEKVSTIPAFQTFWQRNSIMGQLFPTPPNNGTATVVAGLQTRIQVQSIVNQRLPGALTTNGSNSTDYLQQQLQQAQGQISALKDKISQLGGGNSDMVMPDFTPNSQKTKSFLKRFEYGINFQTAPAVSPFPAISDIGLTLGYRLSDKAIVGIGGSYKLGLGNGLSHIAFTSQGAGLRSYLEIKAKGSIWITGGYEYDYMQQFAKLSDLQDINAWQKSALLGITKKYRIGKNKQGNLQLLYDFLYKHEVPRGQALKFRIGYSF